MALAPLRYSLVTHAWSFTSEKICGLMTPPIIEFSKVVKPLPQTPTTALIADKADADAEPLPTKTPSMYNLFSNVPPLKVATA
jgi:hypothetical protein